MAASSLPKRLHSILELPDKHRGVLMDQFGVSLPHCTHAFRQHRQLPSLPPLLHSCSCTHGS